MNIICLYYKGIILYLCAVDNQGPVPGTYNTTTAEQHCCSSSINEYHHRLLCHTGSTQQQLYTIQTYSEIIKHKKIKMTKSEHYAGHIVYCAYC